MLRLRTGHRLPIWGLPFLRICRHATSATFPSDSSSTARTKLSRTMAGLEQHRGHFYNWYDTESLKPLLPMYVSSVDSGNLAASLLTLRAGLLALPDEKPLGARLFDGLWDTFMVLSDAVGTGKPAALARLEKDLESARASLAGFNARDRERKHRPPGGLCRGAGPRSLGRP